jgi:NAD(P)-dependent dehydrogenase (short-subunit alcohol dehydrogenase family)
MANNLLADRTVVISGGSRGIGLAIGIAAAKQGANVVLLAKTGTHPRLPGTVHTAAADVEAAGGKALAVVGDVRREEDGAGGRGRRAAVRRRRRLCQQRQRHRGGSDRPAVGQPTRAHHLAAGEHESALAGRAPVLHAVQVRDDAAITGLGR